MSKKGRRATARKAPTSPLLSVGEAAEYLGVSRRWLEGNSELAPVDLSTPGSTRPMLRYARAELDRYVALCARRSAERRRAT